jgi:hypothetical protein
MQKMARARVIAAVMPQRAALRQVAAAQRSAGDRGRRSEITPGRRNSAIGRRLLRATPFNRILTIRNHTGMSEVQNPSKPGKSNMRRAIALVGSFGIVGAGLSLAIIPVSRGTAAPKPAQTYLLPAADGYGVADCIASRSDCGQIVADAWCEANGHRVAKTFGLASAEDFTGTTVTKAATTEQPLAITCEG